jgi:23S rRNA (cytidine1920-2'-O)/16S rRNA (cytidine1409-2'-O)-methyltransferase
VELVRRGLARSRGQARDLLAEGAVRVDDLVARKASHLVDDSTPICVESSAPHWVSRGAGKLAAAFAEFAPRGLRVEGRRCLDVGASTGGFTQVLLEKGAAHVTALDVGHDQLAPQVREDPRVEERSHTSIRGVRAADLAGPFDLVVADLSFISLTLVLPTLAALVAQDGDLVVLVKPQFEVGRARLGKDGVVRSPTHRAGAVIEVARAARDAGLFPRGLARSPVRGGEGNAEYLLWIGTDRADGLPWDALVVTAEQLSVEDGPA